MLVCCVLFDLGISVSRQRESRELYSASLASRQRRQAASAPDGGLSRAVQARSQRSGSPSQIAITVRNSAAGSSPGRRSRRRSRQAGSPPEPRPEPPPEGEYWGELPPLPTGRQPARAETRAASRG